MTFVGKILVLVITALALVFLGVSTVVFTTATNWKEATEDAKEERPEASGRDQRPEVADRGLREGQARRGDSAQGRDQAARRQSRRARGRHHAGAG